MVMFKRETSFRLSDHILVSSMNEDLVVFDTEKGVYYGINDIGTVLWEHIQQQKTLGELIATLLQRFDVNEEKCWQDVSKILNKMVAQQLIYPCHL